MRLDHAGEHADVDKSIHPRELAALLTPRQQTKTRESSITAPFAVTLRSMSQLASRLDAVLDAALAAQRIVGGVVRVARRGNLVYHRALGLADREAGRAMTDPTPFRLASLTKPVTAVATLGLVATGRLALDHPVTRWLPDFRPRLGDAAPPITIHQLLTHTSGLGYSFLEPLDGPYHRANVSDGLDQPGLSLADNLRRLASVPLRCAPGTAFNYSLSLDVLGGILERAADAPLPDVIARIVTDPLELTDLRFTPRSPAEAAALAVAYSDGPPPQLIREGVAVPFPPFEVQFSPSRALDPASYPSGGAGMIGTASDFLRFLEALRTRAIPTVPSALLDAMLRDQIAPITSPLLHDGWGYGYAVAVLRDPIATASPMPPGAVRWGGAYGHSWTLDPTTETSTVLLTNTAFEGMSGALRDDVIQAVYQ
jgi:CubicO group peptidase (beta-lactamase class C family)